jgi:hypothetical protein
MSSFDLTIHANLKEISGRGGGGGGGGLPPNCFNTAMKFHN